MRKQLLYLGIPVLLLGASFAAAQDTPARARGSEQEKKLVHKVAPVYPPLAKQAGIEGTVELEVTIGKTGSVENADVLSGHPLLVDAALQAVRQWRYEPTVINGEAVPVVTKITVNFALLSQDAARVSGSDQEKRLVDKVRPAYPPLAKQARIQGRVRLEATISETGDVERVRVVSGHPLLVEAAVEAVRKWKYEPTLVDGRPVKVITTIDVNFKLPEAGPSEDIV